MPPNADRLLIEQAQQGDEHAFSDLLDRYYDLIYRIALRWSGHSTNAEDITQQACMKLARSIEQFRFESAFSSWLYRLVINCAKDWHKSEHRHPEGDDSYEDVAEQSLQQEQQIYLNQILKWLDTAGKDMKETALLIFAEGLSHREAADVLEVKESTISWRIHEIRKLLMQREAPYER